MKIKELGKNVHIILNDEEFSKLCFKADPKSPLNYIRDILEGS